MICGIVALVLSVTIILSIVGLVLGVVGLVLSSIGLSQAKERGADNGMAVAGLVCLVDCDLAFGPDRFVYRLSLACRSATLSRRLSPVVFGVAFVVNG